MINVHQHTGPAGARDRLIADHTQTTRRSWHPFLPVYNKTSLERNARLVFMKVGADKFDRIDVLI